MSVLATLESPAVATADFATELERVGAPLQGAFRRLLDEWGSPASATELARLSGVGMGICWRFYRVAQATDLAAEAKNVPSPTFLKKFLQSAQRAGIPEETIRAVEVSADAFKSFMKRAATDRAAFDSMTAAVSSPVGGEKIQASQRRAVYRGMSHILGLQTDLIYLGTMLRHQGEVLERLSLLAQRGVRRLRPEAYVTLYGYAGSGAVRGSEMHEPLDGGAAERYGIPLLPAFSTTPFPKVEKLELSSGYTQFNLASNGIGPMSEVNFTIGQLTRTMREEGKRRFFHVTYDYIRKPVAMAVQELLIHRGSFPGIRPEMMVYRYMEGLFEQASVEKLQRLPVEERLMRIGPADGANLEALPGYRELLRFGAERAGYDLSEFDVWRVVVGYPIMNSSVRIYFYEG